MFATASVTEPDPMLDCRPTAPLLLRDHLVAAAERLRRAGCDTPRLDAEVLLAHALDQDRTWLYRHFLQPLDSSQLNRFDELLERRERRLPVAYLTGAKEFFGLAFEVNQHVLIPRPETELLVETALQVVDQRAPATIVDVGTGSGCIAISLAKHRPLASVRAVDISGQALSLACLNARRHNVEHRVDFLHGDLLEPVTGSVDVIVSNPPYVSRPELLAAQPEVGQFEPRQALAGGEDGLVIIRRLLPQAKQRLKPGGTLLVEIGASQGQAVTVLARQQFPRADVRIKQDLAGLDRLLVIKNLE